MLVNRQTFAKIEGKRQMYNSSRSGVALPCLLFSSFQMSGISRSPVLLDYNLVVSLIWTISSCDWISLLVYAN